MASKRDFARAIIRFQLPGVTLYRNAFRLAVSWRIILAYNPGCDRLRVPGQLRLKVGDNATPPTAFRSQELLNVFLIHHLEGSPWIGGNSCGR